MNGQPDLMGMITSPGSWEQVIYDVVAWEGLDPWDIDLKRLAEGFLKYMQKLEEMDFKVPAKFLMVSATLLRMKSDHLALLNYFQEDPELAEENGSEIMVTEEPVINLLTIPPRRMPTRRIVVSELVAALRKAMGTSQRRVLRSEQAKGLIKLKNEDIGKRINALYDRINSILSKARGGEVEFSKVVEWNRKGVSEAFMPLVFLDHEKKVSCRQEEMFDEIYIKHGEEKEVKPEPPKKIRRMDGTQKAR